MQSCLELLSDDELWKVSEDENKTTFKFGDDIIVCPLEENELLFELFLLGIHAIQVET